MHAMRVLPSVTSIHVACRSLSNKAFLLPCSTEVDVSRGSMRILRQIPPLTRIVCGFSPAIRRFWSNESFVYVQYRQPHRLLALFRLGPRLPRALSVSRPPTPPIIVGRDPPRCARRCQSAAGFAPPGAFRPFAPRLVEEPCASGESLDPAPEGE